MCLFPWTASIDPDGGRPSPDPDGNLKLSCGKCHECISLRATEWATRARHEISLHEHNCFLTLTYDDEHLPSHLLVKHPFQRFLKRLREKTKKKISYIVSHEYGSQFFRPHHHAIIFGYDPLTQNFLRNTKSGHPLFTSPEISELWQNGFHSIGQANEKTAYYIASYALKGASKEIYLPNGEFVTVSDSFDCSKRPGIGLNFLKKNYKQLVASKTILPRYYQKKLADLDPDLLQDYEDYKMQYVKNNSLQTQLAKLTINNSKNMLSDNEFRSAPDAQIGITLENYLKTDINSYARYKKENL